MHDKAGTPAALSARLSPDAVPYALTDRQSEMMRMVLENGFIATEQMSERFNVTPQTVRLDIKVLCELNLVQRIHGGAGQIQDVEQVPYRERLMTHPVEKRKIAELVASHVPDGASVFIHIGTTTEAVALALGIRKDLKIITNNLNVANEIFRHTGFSLDITAGDIRPSDGGIVGKDSIESIQRYRPEFGVIGVNGVAPDGSLLDIDVQASEAARVMMRVARTVLLVADHTKFDHSALIRFGDMHDIDHVFTDLPPPAHYAGLLKAAGVRVHVADPA